MGFLDNLFGDGRILSDGEGFTGRNSNPFGGLGNGSSSSFNPFSPDKDDKRAKAKQLINEAKQLVRDGEEIYRRAKDSTDRAYSRTQRAIDSYIRFCEETSKLLNTQVKPVMKRFDAFDIDARISKPHIDSIVQMPSFGGLTSGIVSMPTTPSILSQILDEYQYEKAKEQRDEAKAYKEEMKFARSQLNALRDKLNNIRSYVESEQDQINTLTQKVLRISTQLEEAMLHTSFDPEQANYLKTIQKIAIMIADQISTEFISDGLEITNKYKVQADLLNKVNATIPASPVIDGQEALNLIRDLSNIIPIET